MSFDVYGHNLPCLGIYGTEGTLYVPDPNNFGGEVKIKHQNNQVEVVPLTHGYMDNACGIGMADMVLAMKNGRERRCNSELAYHILDLMHGFHDSSANKKFIEIDSTCKRPDPLPMGLEEGEIDRIQSESNG